MYHLNDTTFIDSLQNTESHTFYYRLALYNQTNNTSTLIDHSDLASSVYLQIDPTDQALLLHWNETVPWKNTSYKIYRYNPTTLSFDSIALSTQQSYIDNPLTNGEEYCYYIESIGHYDDTNTIRPIYNKSQIHCAIPVDNISPCTPVFNGETDCIDIDLTWQFPFDSCFEDVYTYYIYYSDKADGDFIILDSITDKYQTTYKLIHPKSVIGCFIIRIADSIMNYSSYSNKVCFDIDICNLYRLPNIFSPNGDNINDLFTPFYPYELVESVNMYIYNRWGDLIYQTVNPDILWDGTNQKTKKPCSEGVYYYACDIKEYTLFGLRIRYLQGSITLVR